MTLRRGKTLTWHYNWNKNWDKILRQTSPGLRIDAEFVPMMSAVALRTSRWVELAKLRTSPDQMLVTPAVASDLDWMKNFLCLLPNQVKPDYLAVHVYSTTFESFRNQVEAYHRTFGLPIMLTEFAMHVCEFMGQTTSWMDKTDFVM
ncbi:hypothetical protein JCM24511_10209 [Saitozyma sp. JCM 24511]|nr:hypothetical protein JCM24511_10209 [Saitozyma sp. JCM 24511]